MAGNAEFELKTAPVLVKSFGGCGVQLNHHTFAKQTTDENVPQATFDDLKQKVRDLSPHVVRIFFNDQHDGVPFDDSLPPSLVNVRQGPIQKDRWASFVETVKLAQDIGATINITWQGGKLVTDRQRTTAAARLANVLEILVKGDTRAENLRWLTIANEPNTAPKKADAPQNMTPPRLGATYRELDKHLAAKGLRKQIRFMGGDLIEGSKDVNSPFHQAKWFAHMHRNMPGVFDSFSTHIYWDYDDTDRFKDRLKDVRDILNGLAGNSGAASLQYPLPVYVTEFGTRSKDRGHDGAVDPGNFVDSDGAIPLTRTNVAAFQAAWFQISAARMGFTGMLKWDCNFGRYDKGKQAYYAIGKPIPPNAPKGWELFPMYHLLRLFTLTTAPGWKVLPVVRNENAAGSGTKHLVAFQGPDDLTIIGLDDRGAPRQKPTSMTVPYEIGGLTGRGPLQLVLWNKAGGGLLHRESVVKPDAAGVVRLENVVPLHSVFALTTRPVPQL
jgi:hypothetical protein